MGSAPPAGTIRQFYENLPLPPHLPDALPLEDVTLLDALVSIEEHSLIEARRALSTASFHPHNAAGVEIWFDLAAGIADHVRQRLGLPVGEEGAK